MKKFAILFAFAMIGLSMIACQLTPSASGQDVSATATPANLNAEGTPITPDGRIATDHSDALFYDPAKIDEWQFETEGVPEVISMDDVDYPRTERGFNSPWPYLSTLGEPGKLMVGADFPQAQIDGSRGATRRVDPGNTYRLMNNDFTVVGCEEGALVYFTVQYARITIEDGMEFAFRAPDGSGTHVYVRCPALDPARGVDAGESLVLSDYRAGYGLVQHFSPEPAGGFISSDGALQALGISQTLDSCGGNGCISTYVLSIDGNNGAYSVARWNGSSMELIESNWWAAQ